MRHTGSHSQHHTKAVEHGHLDHHTVGRGEVHTVSDAFAVIYDVVMGQHNTLGKARSAGSVLHIADIILVHCRCTTIQLFHRHHVSSCDRVFPGDTTCLLEADSDDIA